MVFQIPVYAAPSTVKENPGGLVPTVTPVMGTNAAVSVIGPFIVIVGVGLLPVYDPDPVPVQPANE